MTPFVVLLDLDGTLVDTNYLHVEAWQGALRATGHDVPTAWIHERIGMAADLMAEDLLGPGDHEAFQEERRRRFAPLRDEARPLPGASDLIRAITAAGGRAVVASSSEQEDADALLELLGCSDDLHAVTTAGDVEDAKPAPDVFEAAMQAGEGNPDRTVAVGDTVWDVAAAARAGLPCIGVETGGIGRATLLEAGAATVVRDPAELAGRLGEVLAEVLGHAVTTA